MNFLKRIRQFLLSRATILTLIVLASGSMLLGSFIPQSFLLTPKGLMQWHADYPVISVVAGRLGLQHIYTHPIFAVIILLASGSLLLSCIEQCKKAWRRTCGEDSSGGADAAFTTTADPESVTLWLRQRGYRIVASGAFGVRLCRQPWGYWGNALLHVGMLVVIISSLWIALTQQRGKLHLAVRESFRPGEQWLSTEKGLLAKDPALDSPVRLESVSYEFWPTYGVKNVASRLTFQGRQNESEPAVVEVNRILYRHGMSIYQTVDFGHAFYVEVTDPVGTKKTYQLLLTHPEKPDTPSYGDYPDMLGPGILLRAKYLVDPEKGSFARGIPRLVLRMEVNGTSLGQLPLAAGTEETLGRFRFRLIKIDLWSGLIFVKFYGIQGVFFGFLIIIIGSSLNYFTPPRDVLVGAAANGKTVVSWRASKFKELYLDEFDRLDEQFNPEKTHG